MKLVFWGVRGSIPVPGPHTVRYGGNTSCVQVELGPSEPILIFDAGTGIRELGQALSARTDSLDIHIFITHAHWDHIQGLPFFDPLFKSNCSITFYSLKRRGHALSDVVNSVIETRYFPLSRADWEARIRFVEFENEESFSVGSGISVSTSRLNHPWIANAYRVDYQNKSMVYATDTAPFEHVILDWDFISRAPDVSQPVDPQIKEQLQVMRHNLISLCKDADVLIYDTMFTDEQYARNPHWGHSAPSHALAVCEESGVRHLVMFHHAPERSDEEMDILVADAVELASKTNVKISAAQEGHSILL
ncbi:MBL fold metallo-hydrolase [Myxococcota bacterium]|nr:MBL fold metallo-hydrolase [Myxococcota bacterium]MBU1535876.1 MBL fold metallo-hydrolase [Myxococcota bacterium]